ncbi:MAG: response regulator [Rhodospirillaceae bacterium]|nr:response regulator [Rhodospirillaceae bacterium]
MKSVYSKLGSCPETGSRRAGLYARAGMASLAASLMASPAAAATERSVAVNGILLGIAVALVGLIGISIWLFRRAERQGAQARLRGEALDALPQAILVTDALGETLQINAAWRGRVPGREEKALEALEESVSHDEAGRKAFARLRASALANGVADAEIPVRQANGQNWWCRISVRPMPQTAGAVQWSLEDSPARNALDQAVAAEQNRLIQFLDDFPIGYYSVDQEGSFRHANRTFADWLGTTPTALINGDKKLHDLLAEDSPRAAMPWRGLNGEEETNCGEITFAGSEGHPFKALLAETAIMDGDGLRTRSLVRDLSSERGTTDALRQAEKRFHRFFDEAPVGIVLLDSEGVVTECSTAFARMASNSADAIDGKEFWQCVIEDDCDRVRQWVRSTAMGDEATSLQVMLTGDASSEKAEDGVVAALFARRFEADDGGPGGVVVHALDQTEQRNLDTQFFQSQKMELVGQLAGGIAHDFNNLLTAMIGFCDLLLQRHSSKDQSFADIMQIRQNANRAANLVRQLLAFSRQQTLQPKVLVITDVLAELSHLLRRLIGADVELNMVHGRDLWQVKVDQSQLEQVIINLAVNARDAVQGGGTLTIRTSNLPVKEIAAGRHPSLPPGNYVTLEVSDTGEGIPKDIVDKIFEPFFTTKEVGSGTGLGLSTVYGIINQTGGHIFVDSELGEGACFTIYLPQNESSATESEEDAAPVEATPEPAASDLTGFGTVMLVEDEDAVRMFGARALRNKGYNVVEAASGEEALEILKTDAESIDVLITDVVMPGLDGPAMIRKVREIHPDMRVVFISGYTEDSFRKRLDEDSGEIHFLPKPFTLQQLAGVVKEVMPDSAA